MYIATQSLNERMLRMSDDELLDIVTTHRAQYRQVAVDLAAKELMRRNLPLPVINNLQSGNTDHLPCLKEPEPKERGNDSFIPWLITYVVVTLFAIIDRRAPDYSLLPDNQIARSVVSWVGIACVIYHLYRLYKWYQSED